MTAFEVHPIGTIKADEEGMFVKIDPMYIPALKALDGFSHINVLWWFSECDCKGVRSMLQTPRPYQDAPEVMGIFATRSPARPNPLALTACEVLDIDYDQGIIKIAYIDANDKTPVLDVKPYTPSLDRVENPGVPAWCSRWPRSIEESGLFDWEKVFLF